MDTYGMVLQTGFPGKLTLREWDRGEISVLFRALGVNTHGREVKGKEGSRIVQKENWLLPLSQWRPQLILGVVLNQFNASKVFPVWGRRPGLSCWMAIICGMHPEWGTIWSKTNYHQQRQSFTLKGICVLCHNILETSEDDWNIWGLFVFSVV